VLVGVPMFHANGWGFAFAGPAAGAKLVLPGRNQDGASLAKLINDEGVTVAAGVATVWLGLVDHLEQTGGTVPSLQRILLGGSSVPQALMDRFEARLGVTVQTSWGMTELSPLGAISPRSRQPGTARGSGRPPLGLDLLLTDAEGAPLPEQRNAVGHLKVKGQSVIERYFDAAETALGADGWFDTGDLATLDDAGNLTLAGRSKDLIKSGGEWINPVEIEEIIGALPSVGLVAVIGRADPKWGERPLMVVEPARGRDIDDAALKAMLKGRVADWWIPERIVRIEAMPLAATGKINKTLLRATYGGA
jgi:fatty-acyl-CoA synthase